MNKDMILIAGPTASGKTGLSIELAEKYDGVVINADSMQVYDVLSVLTARPSKSEMGSILHKLFGHMHPSQIYSTAKWIEDVRAQLIEIRRNKKTPIFVGGTGLYFKTLIEGLSSIPEIDPEIRTKWRDFSLTAQRGVLHSTLEKTDPNAAKILNEGDTQRIVRALEVIDSTGKSILYWQSLGNGIPLVDADAVEKIILLPERSFLNERISQRFSEMLIQGAVEEVEALLALDLPNENPAMRAIGVSQIGKYLAGEISLEEAGELASIATRQYAKRQSTWFRNQFAEGWQIVESPQLVETKGN